MNIYYINLDSAEERRNAIEENLAAYSNGARYERISAIDADYVERNEIKGKIRAGEKGCFLSHIKAIEKSLESDEPSLILEDDAVLGAGTVGILNNMLPTIDEVDLLFTDLCVPNATSMLQLFMLRRDMGDNSVGVFPTGQISFAASSAYVLPNTEAKKKTLDLLKAYDSLDSPYDLALRILITANRLKSSFLFPFLTSLSSLATSSQLRLTDESVNNVIYNTFRKLMFKESERFYPDLLADLNSIPADFYDREAIIFGELWKLVLAKKLPAAML
jgi:GR25 family glycosyltransferase involved in LPS biosynthesis